MSDINSVSNMLSEEKIREGIVNKDLQNIKIVAYDITDSTNTRAKEYYAENADCRCAVFIANGQTAGRGRRGRRFDSASGAGIYISFLLGGEYDASELTVRAAVKCARAIERASRLSVGIKWVNDIFAGGKKLAGILAEGGFDTESGAQKYAVLGIGINLYKRTFPAEIADIAASVEDFTNDAPDKYKLIAALIDEIFSEDSPDEIMKEYRRRSTVIGKEVRVKRIAGGEFDAQVIGIADSGALVVRHVDGSSEELISAEISISHKNYC